MRKDLHRLSASYQTCHVYAKCKASQATLAPALVAPRCRLGTSLKALLDLSRKFFKPGSNFRAR
jgi:hypothetical protein